MLAETETSFYTHLSWSGCNVQTSWFLPMFDVTGRCKFGSAQDWYDVLLMCEFKGPSANAPTRREPERQGPHPSRHVLHFPKYGVHLGQESSSTCLCLLRPLSQLVRDVVGQFLGLQVSGIMSPSRWGFALPWNFSYTVHNTHKPPAQIVHIQTRITNYS